MEGFYAVCLSHNAPGYIPVRLTLQTVLLVVVSPGQDWYKKKFGF